MAQGLEVKIIQFWRAGWVFSYEKSSQVLSMYHPKFGKINLVELFGRSILVDCEDVGRALEDCLNNRVRN